MSATTPTVCILAAGRGSRLGGLTDTIPKSFLDLGRGAIIDLQLEALAHEGVRESDIRIVTGHAADAVRERFGTRFELIHNPLWDVHNNIVTVQRLAADVPRDLLLINGDTLFSRGILAELLAAEGDAVLAVDTHKPLAEEEMKVQFVDGRMRAIGKHLDPTRCDGEYIGLLHFRDAALAAFYTELDRMVAAGRTDDWYEGALNAVAETTPIRAASTRGLPWIEVDTPDDLAAARSMAPGLET